MTHIRDYFRKDFQKNKNASTGSAAKKVKKYVYADLLYFLIPVFDKRNTGGNYQSDDLLYTIIFHKNLKPKKNTAWNKWIQIYYHLHHLYQLHVQIETKKISPPKYSVSYTKTNRMPIRNDKK